MSPSEAGQVVLAGYLLHEKLGAGTTGEVWLATQIHTEQRVAVKLLSTHGVMAQYFADEVHRLATLAEHPHVVTLLDANLANDPPFLVMPLLPGSLEKMTEKAAGHGSDQFLAHAERWIRHMVSALQYMHRKGIMHCDLKPANVLIDGHDNLLLVDFGQSQVQGQPGLNLGTFWYMPPEQASFQADPLEFPVPDVSWDIYSLGATLYQMLTGCLPRSTPELESELTRQDDMIDQLSVYRRLLLAAPLVPVRTLNKRVDADLAAIVEHCLEPDPDKRYHSMDEVLTDLERRSQSLPLQAHPHDLGYIVRRFARRNAVPLIAFLVIMALQMSQVFLNLRGAEQAAVHRLQDDIDRTAVLLRDFEATRYRWLDLLALSESSEPTLHKVLLTTDFGTWHDSFQEIIDRFAGSDDDTVLLLLTDARGETIVRTDAATAPHENLSTVPAVENALRGNPDPSHGYWKVGSRLYQISVVPWFRGHYVDGAFLVGQAVTDPVAQTIAKSTDSQVSFADTGSVFASSFAASTRPVLLSTPPERREVQIEGHRYLVRYIPLEQADTAASGNRIILHVATDPQLEPLRRLQTSYIAEAVGAMVLGALIFGSILWRAETAVLGRSRSARKAA